MPFDLQTYLNRIGLTSCEPTLEGLRALQSHQMSAIPFENVLAFLGQIPDVSPQGVWRKLIENRLGGYCFEVNTLFGQALDAVGFEVQPVLARVRKGPPQSWNRSHLTFVVTIDGAEWLADVGFGGPAPAEPVSLETAEKQTVRGQGFRIGFDKEAQEQVLEREMEDGWLPLYSFDRARSTKADIEAANYICATWDQKPFTANMMVACLTETGRMSFLNGTARQGDEEGSRSWQITTPDAFRTFMREELGLAYADDVIGAIWQQLETLHPQDQD